MSAATPAQRAATEKLVAYPTSNPHVWECSKYTIRITGPEPEDVRCSCPDSVLRGRFCKHDEAVKFFREQGLRPVKPADGFTPAHAVKDANDPLHVFCRDCGAESFAGVTLCILCSAERIRRWGGQDEPAQTPVLGFVTSATQGLTPELLAAAQATDRANALVDHLFGYDG